MAQGSLVPQRSSRAVGFAFADPFLALHREMNRLFDDVLRATPATVATAAAIVPTLDVSETDHEVRVRAELPGVAEEDIEVSVDGDLLTIRAEKRQDRREGREDFHVVESSYGTVRRTLRLPYAADPGHVQARFENGVLTITLPKAKAGERSRRIPIQGPANRTGSEGAGTAATAQSGEARKPAASAG